MAEIWKIRVVRMYKELNSVYTRIDILRSDFILKSGEARNVLISNQSKSIVISVKKSIDSFLNELERFEESIHNNSEISKILEFVCASKVTITNNLDSQVKYFLSIFDYASPSPSDIDLTIQTFQDFFDCYNSAIENLLTL